MPVSCSTSVLTGQDGACYFKPPGTGFCLLDYTDFGDSGNTNISVPTENDYELGDPVVFRPEGSATLDSSLTAGITYYVRAGGRGTGFIQVSASPGGTSIAMTGDGGEVGTSLASVATATPGVGYVDGTYYSVQLVQGVNSTARGTVVVAAGAPTVTAVTTPGIGYTATLGSISITGGDDGNGNAVDQVLPDTDFVGDPTLTDRSDTPGVHINVSYAEFGSVCQVRDFTVEITREELEVSTLPCNQESGSNTGKYVQFRTYQPGYGDGTGSMTVYFTSDQQSLANRILRSVLLRRQEGAEVRLYVNYVSNDAGDGPDNVESQYIQAPISLTSMNLSTDPDNPQEATVNFRFAGQPSRLFGTDL